MAYGQADEVRELFAEYTGMLVEADSELARYLQIQGYDAELLHLEEKYGMPYGRLYLAYVGGEAAGCIGLRRMDERTCEMKRLYVRPQYRGHRIADHLVRRVIADAQHIGYRAMLLDTMPFLPAAVQLYRKYGFYEIRRYNDSPVEDAIYMRLDLPADGRGQEPVNGFCEDTPPQDDLQETRSRTRTSKGKALKPRPSREKKSRAQGKAEKREQKKQQKKDARLKKLESEVERLRGNKETEAPRTRRRLKPRPEQEAAWQSGENGQTSILEELGEAAAKGAAQAAVVISRLMQLASALAMAGMVLVMAQSFWAHGQEMGDIRLVMAEANYGLAVYAGFAGISLFMGAVWCLWILSRRGAGGGVRMKRYDTGRGLVPFVLCLAAVAAAGILLPQIPQEEGAWRGLAAGIRAAAEAVDARRGILLSCAGLGACLSLIRKLLSV